MIEREGSFFGVVADRLDSESRPGRRTDGFKVALVIEGGCMRGVVSAGMTLAVGRRIVDALDAVYGVSAGSAAAAYLLAGQAEAISIYYEDVNRPEFLDPRRFFSGEPMVDIPYLTHKVMKEIKPLHWERVIDHPIELHIMVTEARQAQTVDFNYFESQDDLLDAIHYSCRMPLIAGWPVEIDGQTAYTDGAVVTGGICLTEALADGCSHVLVLRSGLEGEVPNEGFSMAEILGYFLLRDEYPRLARAILHTYRRRYCKTLKMIEAAETENPSIESICLPKTSQPVAPFEMDKRKLIRGARDGYRAAVVKFREIRRRS